MANTFGSLITCFAGIALLTSCASENAAGPSVKSACLATDIPASTELSLIGAYEAESEESAASFSGNDEVDRVVRLKAGYFVKPQIVVLSGHDSITWDFSSVPEEKILGVITYGYSKQSVKNLPNAVPLKQVDYEGRNSGPASCGGYFSVHKGGPELDRVVDQVERAVGLKVSRFRGAYRSSEFSLDGDGQQAAQPAEEYLMAESGPYAGIDPREKPDRYPGHEAVTSLIDQGKIRPATQDDIDAWNKRATEELTSGHLAAYEAEDLQRPQVYVVLEPFDLPVRMRMRSLIYQKDISPPEQGSSQNSFYYMKTGTCGGAAHDCPGERNLNI